MKKTFFTLVIVILGSIALAGCQLPGTTNEQVESTENQASSEPIEVVTEPQAEQMEMSFVDLMRLGENYKCSYSYESDGNTMTGMAYVAAAGNKVNGEFKLTTADGQQHNSYVVSDGEYSYIWSDLQDKGIKMKIDEDPESIFSDEEVADNEEQVRFDQDQQMKFDCERWIPENSKFIPPSNIEFIDFAAQMEQMQQQLQGASGNACDTCDQLPAGDTQDQCRAALGC